MPDGPPKYLVVEVNGKSDAVNLVQIMLNNGYARLMLLDDLAKHPNLQTKPTISSQLSKIVEKKEDVVPGLITQHLPRVKESGLSIFEPTATGSTENQLAQIKQEDIELIDNNSSWINQLTKSQPEIVPIDVDVDFYVDYLRGSDPTMTTQDEGPSKKKNKIDKLNDPDYHQCQLCHVRVKAPRSGRWNLQMHVVALHSTKKMYKCPECDYEDYRKTTMRKHGATAHQKELVPINIITNEKRFEWNEVMGKCFPELAHRTGFLNELKQE